MMEVLLIIIAIVAGIILFVWLFDVVYEEKWAYWRRPDHLKDLSHQAWKGYRARWNDLEGTQWSQGWDRATQDFEKRETP